jgi:protein tyrosine phosphatase (PTP) superfamily phosphohydrolase (DUF442 family)
MRCLNITVLSLSLVTILGCGGREKPAVQDNQLEQEASVAGKANSAAMGQRAEVFLPDDGPTDKDYPELHNLMQVTGSVYSGAEPKTEAAFQQLADLGVKVIVSVDGAKPKVDLAKKYGMRYVHIPIGYDGIDAEAGRSFARAADELNETTYVHCHHGEHRGPAGAAAICVARGDADGERALRILERAGTSKGYAGLWRDVQGYRRPVEKEELPELVAVAEVGSLAAAMAQIDRASDNLKLCQADDWQTPADHPDISPSQEALLLKEGFHETIRQLAESNDNDEQFLTWMKESEQSATQLEAALKAGDMTAVQSTFGAIQSQCKRCHAEHRN